MAQDVEPLLNVFVTNPKSLVYQGFQKKIILDYLKDASGSIDMNVDGRNPNKSFKFNCNQNDDIYITSLRLYAKRDSITLLNFLGVAKLTNGLNVNIKTNANLINFATLKETKDIMLFLSNPLSDFNLIDGADDIVISNYNFFNPIKIRKCEISNNDYIEFVIRDDLRGIKEFFAFVIGFTID
jgi:hypothetical protein